MILETHHKPLAEARPINFPEKAKQLNNLAELIPLIKDPNNKFFQENEKPNIITGIQQLIEFLKQGRIQELIYEAQAFISKQVRSKNLRIEAILTSLHSPFLVGVIKIICEKEHQQIARVEAAQQAKTTPEQPRPARLSALQETIRACFEGQQPEAAIVKALFSNLDTTEAEIVMGKIFIYVQTFEELTRAINLTAYLTDKSQKPINPIDINHTLQLIQRYKNGMNTLDQLPTIYNLKLVILRLNENLFKNKEGQTANHPLITKASTPMELARNLFVIGQLSKYLPPELIKRMNLVLEGKEHLDILTKTGGFRFKVEEFLTQGLRLK